MSVLAVASAVVALAAPAPVPLHLPTTTSVVTVSLADRSFAARLVRPKKTGTYPVVAFGHGFLLTSARYASTLRAMAARGYIVVAPDSQTSVFSNHSQFADDLELSLRWARTNVRGASPTRDAVAGHSMGGGAALLAADRYPSIDTVATLAAAETKPSAKTASAGITAPALYVVGSDDAIVPPALTRTMYDAKPGPATFASITGGSHCGFADSTPLGGVGCDSGSIPHAGQLRLTHELLGGWLDSRFRRGPAVTGRAGVVVTSK